MTAPLAVVPWSLDSSHPDAAWIRKHVSVFAVGGALGLRIRNRTARCWRPENHTNGDAHPSLHFFERKNRVRCFVCDMRGGHSCIDLVMGCEGIGFTEAVNWIAERFSVPNVKPGRPIGNRSKDPRPYRIGVYSSEIETLVRSGMFGQLSPAERSILIVLKMFEDPDTGLTKLSYQAIMRYAGVGWRKGVSQALTQLQRLHAIQICRGSRIGITRECSCYRVTLEDPKFIERCNHVYAAGREEIEQERTYRRELRAEREKNARITTAKANHATVQNSAALFSNSASLNEAGGYAPPDPALILSRHKSRKGKPTCEGLNLSSSSELISGKSVLNPNREIRVLEHPADDELLAWNRKEQKAKLNEFLLSKGLRPLASQQNKTKSS
jgi:hypothetical protein